MPVLRHQDIIIRFLELTVETLPGGKRKPVLNEHSDTVSHGFPIRSLSDSTAPTGSKALCLVIVSCLTLNYCAVLG